MQDNDPKHTSRAAQAFYARKGINWWRTPAESPDLNPIENLWHEMKEYIRREVKPTTKLELVNGINAFWAKIDENKCCRYINHLQKVLKEQRTGYLQAQSCFLARLSSNSLRRVFKCGHYFRTCCRMVIQAAMITQVLFIHVLKGLVTNCPRIRMITNCVWDKKKCMQQQKGQCRTD